MKPSADMEIVVPVVSLAGLPAKQISARLLEAFRTLHSMGQAGGWGPEYALARETIREVCRQKKDYLIYKLLDQLDRGNDQELFRTATRQFELTTGTREMLGPKGQYVTRSFSVGLELTFSHGLREVMTREALPLPPEVGAAYSRILRLDRCVAFGLTPSLYRSYEFRKVSGFHATVFTEECARLIGRQICEDVPFAAPELVQTFAIPSNHPQMREVWRAEAGALWAVFGGALALWQGGNSPLRMEMGKRALYAALADDSSTEWQGDFVDVIFEPLRAAFPGLSRVKVLSGGASPIVTQYAVAQSTTYSGAPGLN